MRSDQRTKEGVVALLKVEPSAFAVGADRDRCVHVIMLPLLVGLVARLYPSIIN